MNAVKSSSNDNDIYIKYHMSPTWMAHWYISLGAKGPGFKSQTSPTVFYIWHYQNSY